jgi:hypothetical protein
MAQVDTLELHTKVREMYRQVAEQPHGTYHFETGRRLADRLGYGRCERARQNIGTAARRKRSEQADRAFRPHATLRRQK